MNKLMIILVAFSTVSLMSGCVSEEQRLAKCEAKGISRDVCYHEEKEYWNKLLGKEKQKKLYSRCLLEGLV